MLLKCRWYYRIEAIFTCLSKFDDSNDDNILMKKKRNYNEKNQN